MASTQSAGASSFLSLKGFTKQWVGGPLPMDCRKRLVRMLFCAPVDFHVSVAWVSRR